MDLEEFERQVLAGEITDLEPYFQDGKNVNQNLKNQLYRLTLLKHGIQIDRVIEMDRAIAMVKCIQSGLRAERYREWKELNNGWVLETLAEHGYYLEELVESNYDYVRRAAQHYNPTFSVNLIKGNKHHDEIYDYVANETEPNIDILKAYIESDWDSEITKGALIKYQSLTTEPDTIERTMTAVQLFEAGSPHWARGLTTSQILNVLNSYDELCEQGYENVTEYLLKHVSSDAFANEIHWPGTNSLAVDYRGHLLSQKLNQKLNENR